MRRLSDIGKAEHQPVSHEVLEVAQDEVARLVAENKRLEANNKRLKATIEAQQRQLRALCGKEEAQTHKRGEDWFISSAIDTFLNEERFISDLVLSCDMVAGSLSVVCSDVFAWGCADAEPIDGDEESLTELARYMMENAKWGSTQWACKKRNQQPQAPVAEAMKREGAWPKFMDCLLPNKYDAYRAEQIALRDKPVPVHPPAIVTHRGAH
jgi:hypothetical protein